MNGKDDDKIEGLEQTKYKRSNQPSESSKEATKTAAKGAANAYLGPMGGKAVDALSKTKLGDAVLTKGAKALEKSPMGKQMAQMADKSGALNAANQAMDAKSGGSGQAPTSSGSAPSSSMNLEDGTSNPKNSKSNFFNKSSSDKTDGNANLDGEVDATTKLANFASKHKFKIIAVILSFFLISFIILIIGSAVISPANTVIEFFRDSWDKMVTFVTGDESTQKWEYEYYEKLGEVQDTLSKKYGVCIDINLITATLTVDVANDHYIDEGKEEADSQAQGGSELTLDAHDYKKMIQQIETLGNMQIRRTVYGLDKRDEITSGEFAGKHCKEESDEKTVTSADGENPLDVFVYSENFVSDLYNKIKAFAVGEIVRDSVNSRKVASNDLQNNMLKFFTRKANEEKNIEYKLYTPAFSEENILDANNNVIGVKKVCYDDVPRDSSGHDFAKLDIGSLNDMENNVYYWNLMDSFIADYYEDYLPKISGPVEEGSEAYEKIKNIISDIYLLYHEMGPNQTCESTSYICRNDEGSDYYGGGETSLKRDEFIDKIAPIAIEEMERTGVMASITIAQAAVESNNGGSGLSSKYSNYYGMTAGSCAPKTNPSGFAGTVYASGEGDNKCQGNAFWNGSVVAMCNSSGQDCQWYRVYDSFQNSTRDHSRLISESYGCTQSNYTEQLSCIINSGYASASNYEKTISSVINTYNLTQYDIGNFDGTIDPITDPQYTNAICNELGASTGDWANWKQYDPKWKSVPLGPSTVGAIGCAMTSVAIQIARSGVSTTLGADFNPGTFAQALTQVGGFDSRGNIDWSSVTKIAPSFHWTGTRVYGSVSPSTIDSLIQQGYYVILNVKNGRHWVAVDRVEGNKIYMFDPGSGGTEVGQTYGLSSVVGYTTYRKG